ncbi:hypothetical protein MPSEU_000266100 [Mayamaea pseudoterrestris]|nr:hypothetical protein MPSEU_000266100 [Mayamaea pseudoterrestris]
MQIVPRIPIDKVALDEATAMMMHPRMRLGYSGTAALLLLAFYVTITTLPNEGRFLRATLVDTSFQGAMAFLESDDLQRQNGPIVIAKEVVLPFNKSFVKQATEAAHDALKIALLLSFPNSGTSYTLSLIRHLTMTSTATNYGNELADGREPVPVFDDQPDGPFWYEPLTQPANYTHPTSYVMTKTHCGLRCEDCPPQNYVETTFSFRRNCLSGGRISALGKKEFVNYPATKVTKAIHLIRNPIDNVVARFNMERRKTTASQQLYPKSREGFLEFCQHMNDRYSAEENRAHFIHQSILATMQNVPCRADFIRYVEWHNLAFATTSDMQLETYNLHYDWYGSRFNETVDELVTFLDANIRGQPEPFLSDKVYTDYFTYEQRARVKLAVKTMASTETWRHIRQYFDEADE